VLVTPAAQVALVVVAVAVILIVLGAQELLGKATLAGQVTL